ncbi:MAG: PEPxxWA-CTERM sorting domain-containing protein [Pseudomonadota bacterium]|uniref:PEPxxWA-CTERM sorting domain-containing protein n=1 Tax=Rhizorhabdus phycosphaerae TaxID=2711156 RepID=UPI0013EC40A6|nr:PEPxxWA-CTERM sorting domain-containing protein [Rhizorhabdus phycosphaerae]
MLKEAVASKAAKLLMTCVCPVAGTTALSLGVPQVRDAVHKATQPRQYAKPKTRVRAAPEEGVQVASAESPCPSVTPFALSNLPTVSPVPMESTPLQVAEAPPPDAAVPLTPRIFVPPSGGVPPPDSSGVPEPSTWVQLMLGFGLIGGVARVSYRRNGSAPTGEAQPS